MLTTFKNTLYHNNQCSLSTIINVDVPFTMAMIALMAKVAVCDAPINSDEIDGLQNIFSFTDVRDREKIYSLYCDAVQDTCSSTIYARQIFYLYSNEKILHEEIVILLLQYAMVDHPLNRKEFNVISSIAKSLIITSDKLSELIKESIVPKEYNEYLILNVPQDVDHTILKQAYITAIKNYHPDSNRNLISEIKPYVSERLTLIKQSYQKILQNINVR